MTFKEWWNEYKQKYQFVKKTYIPTEAKDAWETSKTETLKEVMEWLGTQHINNHQLNDIRMNMINKWGVSEDDLI